MPIPIFGPQFVGVSHFGGTLIFGHKEPLSLTHLKSLLYFGVWEGIDALFCMQSSIMNRKWQLFVIFLQIKLTSPGWVQDKKEFWVFLVCLSFAKTCLLSLRLLFILFPLNVWLQGLLLQENWDVVTSHDLDSKYTVGNLRILSRQGFCRSFADQTWSKDMHVLLKVGSLRVSPTSSTAGGLRKCIWSSSSSCDVFSRVLVMRFTFTWEEEIERERDMRVRVYDNVSVMSPLLSSSCHDVILREWMSLPFLHVKSCERHAETSKHWGVN